MNYENYRGNMNVFRVFRDDQPTLDFLTYNEFANWRIQAAAEGYRPHYSHSVRLRGNYYIYCYQLRKLCAADA